MSGHTDTALFNLLIKTLAGTNYHVILSVEDQVPETELRPLPPNFEVNHSASHLEILPFASLLVCRGGSGNTLEAISHGVPIIAVPLNPEHEAWFRRVEELGLGIRLPREGATVDIIRNTIDRALGEVLLRDRIAQMQSVVRKCGGAAMAADRLEEFLRLRQWEPTL
jgi:MGT family glycosyltransferase